MCVYVSSEKKYDVFLSYSHLDKEQVKELASKIESEYCGDRKLKVYLDEWEMVPGRNIIKSMEEGLQQSRYVVPIISKHSIHAEWPNMEWSIAILLDPSGKKGTVIPFWLGDCEIPPSLKIRSVLYCQDEVSFKKSCSHLISILTKQTPPRGSEGTTENTFHSEQFPLDYGDNVQEQLASNLFPVIDLPKIIWSGPTKFSRNDVFESLRKQRAGVLPTFIIKNGKIFSFWNLNDEQSPFKSLLSANVTTTESIYDWKKTDEQSRWLIELLNRGLTNYCHTLRLKFDSAHRRYYFVTDNEQDRTIQWNTGKRKATRTVVKKHTRGKSEKVFWSHQSLKAKFTIIDEDIFLQLIPGWYFTHDGKESLPSEQIGPLSTKWTTKEHNASVFYHIRFWSNYLSKKSSSIKIPLGDQICEIDTTPAVTELNKGLEGDIDNIEKVFEIANEEINVAEILRDMLVEESQLDMVEVLQENTDE